MSEMEKAREEAFRSGLVRGHGSDCFEAGWLAFARRMREESIQAMYGNALRTVSRIIDDLAPPSEEKPRE